MVENKVEYTTLEGERLSYTETRRIVVPSKKNDKEIVIGGDKKMYLVNSKQHVKWYNRHRPLFDKWSYELVARHIRLPLVRCKAKVLFYFPDSMDRDLTNKFETLADIMVDAGIIIDDTFKVLKPVHTDGWVKRDRPRTEIYLTIIDPADPEYEWDLTSPGYKAALKEKRAIKRKIKRDKTKRL